MKDMAKQYGKSLLLVCLLLITAYTFLMLSGTMYIDAADGHANGEWSSLGFYSSDDIGNFGYFLTSFLAAQTLALLAFPLLAICVKRYLRLQILPWLLTAILVLLGVVMSDLYMEPSEYAAEIKLLRFTLYQTLLICGLAAGYGYLYMQENRKRK